MKILNNRPFILGILLLVSIYSLFIKTPLLHSQETFRFAIHDALDKLADKYIVEKINFGIFEEKFGSKVVYWGVLRNNEPARLTYRFLFDKPMESGRLHANMVTTNFENLKTLGSGKGEGSIWCSNDGKNWIKLLDAPTPKSRTVESYFLHNRLPSEIKGSKELWIQIRMNASGMKSTDYSAGQFCRFPTYSDLNEFIFDLRIRFQAPTNPTKQLSPQLFVKMAN